MVTAAMLAVVLGAQPAFLTTEARRVTLVADAPAVEAPPDLQGYTGWTKQQLRAEYDRLAATRPSLGLPMALMIAGGSAFLSAFYLFAIAGGFAGGPGALPLIILLAVTSVAAAAVIIIGGIVLSRILPDRRAIGRQMDAVERLAESRPDEARRRRDEAPPPYEEPPIIGPPPEGPPPLPLPPMPQSLAPSLPIFLAQF